MKKYQVSYMLGSMYHCYTIVAENEAQATWECMNAIPFTSKKIMSEYKIVQK